MLLAFCAPMDSTRSDAPESKLDFVSLQQPEAVVSENIESIMREVSPYRGASLRSLLLVEDHLRIWIVSEFCDRSMPVCI